MVLNNFALVINLAYAHKPNNECSLIWNKILDKFLDSGFLFEKRIFTISTDKCRDDISIKVRQLLDEFEAEQHDFYSFISDCYILNFEKLSDLIYPDTKNIEVEHISLQDMDTLGIEYELLFETSQ